jgi:hypothetical protein
MLSNRRRRMRWQVEPAAVSLHRPHQSSMAVRKGQATRRSTHGPSDGGGHVRASSEEGRLLFVTKGGTAGDGEGDGAEAGTGAGAAVRMQTKRVKGTRRHWAVVCLACPAFAPQVCLVCASSPFHFLCRPCVPRHACSRWTNAFAPCPLFGILPPLGKRFDCAQFVQESVRRRTTKHSFPSATLRLSDCRKLLFLESALHSASMRRAFVLRHGGRCG